MEAVRLRETVLVAHPGLDPGAELEVVDDLPDQASHEACSPDAQGQVVVTALGEVDLAVAPDCVQNLGTEGHGLNKLVWVLV